MTIRKTPLVVNEIYHVFNRSVARQPIFLSNFDYQRALDVLTFYSYFDPPLRFSHCKRLSEPQKTAFMESLRKKGEKQIELLAFCLMPNHIHFLIKEIREKGISTFMSNFQNSYAKYLNLKTQRNGALFQTAFKAVRIETDEQLIHITRYIHLNPLTSYILKDIEGLINYPWSSFPIYLGKHPLDILSKNQVLGLFSSIDQFISFTKDQVEYQRELDKIKHLALE